MKIIIAGASGFIGQHLLKHYLDTGSEVCAIVPDPKKLEIYSCDNLQVVKATFDDFYKLSNQIMMRDVDIFFYLCWGGYGKATNDYTAQVQNIKPICDAVDEASKIGCKRFLFSSSFSEFMVCENGALTHDQGANSNVYGSAKHAARLMAHAVAAQKKVHFVSVAFANTFGPGDYSKRSTNLFIRRLLNGEAIDLTEGVHLYDWNYIDDTLNGLILAGEKGKDDVVYYIGNNELRPLKDIVSDVRNYLAPGVEIRIGTYKEDFHVDYSCVDVHKLYGDTGYRARWNFKDAILATAEWVKILPWDKL